MSLLPVPTDIYAVVFTEFEIKTGERNCHGFRKCIFTSDFISPCMNHEYFNLIYDQMKQVERGKCNHPPLVGCEGDNSNFMI